MAFAKIARSMVLFATRPMSSLATAIPQRLVLSTFASREGTRSIPADVETVSDISG